MKKRYWLRGGIFVGVLSVVYFILLTFVVNNMCQNVSGYACESGYLYGFLDFSALMLPSYINLISYKIIGFGIIGPLNLVVLGLSNLFMGFVIGSIIGLIYGKIKNKRSKV
jgi:hypothetical protein